MANFFIFLFIIQGSATGSEQIVEFELLYHITQDKNLRIPLNAIRQAP